ncbi:hypothetical protein ACFLT2_13720 [Acidobacteriota bacterium]
MRIAECKKGFPALFVAMVFCLVSLTFSQEQPEPQVDLSDTVKKSTLSDKFEIGIHYGPWTLKPISNWFEDDLLDEISEEIRGKIRDELTDKYPHLIEGDYVDDLQFSTSGSNLGVEIRYHPQGRDGSFSFGFSIERTKIRARIEGQVVQEYTDGTFAEVDSIAYITTNPLTTNLSFRWDINPKWRVSPFFVMGFGVAALIGDAGYEYSGTYVWSGPSDVIGDSDDKTFKEWEEESSENFPNIFYLVQLQLGVRAYIVPRVAVNAELGIWNGLVFRIGLFYRF